MKTRICEHKMDTPCDFNIDSHNCRSYRLPSWQMERETVDQRTKGLVRFNQTVSHSMQIICHTFPGSFSLHLFFFLKDIKTGQIVALMASEMSVLRNPTANYCNFSFHKTCVEHFIKQNVESNLSVAYRYHHCKLKHLQFIFTDISRE